MKEDLKKKEDKVIKMLFNALSTHLQTLSGEKINSKSELQKLEEAVKLCHQIRSLLPPEGK